LSSFFSIIIPTFNSAKDIQDCIDSILIQDCKDVEICVIDGGSTDATVSIVESNRDKGAKIKLISEKDKGTYDAMNKGVELASGEWILFLGSDDSFFDATVLSELKAELNHTSEVVVYGNAKINGNTGWAKDGQLYDGLFTLPKLLNQNICHQAMLYKRSFILNQVGTFRLDYPISSDWDFNLRCWAKQSFRYIPITIANFNAGGVSTDAFDASFSKDYLSNICKYFAITCFHPLLNSPTFIHYQEVLRMQKRENRFRYYAGRLRSKIMGK